MQVKYIYILFALINFHHNDIKSQNWVDLKKEAYDKFINESYEESLNKYFEAYYIIKDDETISKYRKIETLEKIALIFFINSNYSQAIYYLEKSKHILNESNDLTRTYFNILRQLAYAQLVNNNINKAEDYFKQLFEISDINNKSELVGKSDTLTIYNDLAILNFHKGDYNLAFKIIDSSFSFLNKLNNNYDNYSIHDFNKLSESLRTYQIAYLFYDLNNDFENSNIYFIEYLKKKSQIQNNLKNTLEYNKILEKSYFKKKDFYSNLINLYNEKLLENDSLDFENNILLYIKKVEALYTVKDESALDLLFYIYKNLNPAIDNFFRNYIIHKIILILKDKKDHNGINEFLKSLEENNSRENIELYLNNLVLIAGQYNVNKQYSKTIDLLSDTIEFFKNNNQYEKLNGILKWAYKLNGDLEKSIIIAKKTLEVNYPKDTVLDLGHYLLLSEIYSLYFNSYQLDSAESYALKLIYYNKNKYGKESSSYMESLFKLFDVYIARNEVDKAFKLIIENKPIAKNYSTNTSIVSNLFEKQYLRSILKFSNILINLGQFEKAEMILSTEIKNTTSSFGYNSQEYSELSFNLGRLYNLMNNFPMSSKYLNESINYHLKNDQNMYFINTIKLEISQLLINDNKCDSSMIILNEILKQLDNKTNKNSALNIYVMIKLGITNLCLNNVNDAHRNFIIVDSLVNVKSNYTAKFKNVLHYYLSISNLLNDNIYDGINLKNEFIKNLFNFLLLNSNNLTFDEKEKLIFNGLKKINTYHSITTAKFNLSEELIINDFNICLFFNGFLMKNLLNIKKVIINTNDSSILTLKSELEVLNHKIDIYNGKYIGNQDSNNILIKDIQQKAESLERELVQRTSSFIVYPDYTLGKEDITKALSENEVAIQFNSFPYHNGKEWTDSTMYVAYILNNEGMLNYVPLFEHDAIASLIEAFNNKEKSNEVNQNLTLLHKLIWQPLQAHLKDIETIYYAPSGLLHKVPFVALKDSSNNYVGEQYQLQAVLSTRDIPKLKKQPQQSNQNLIALIGGANFDKFTEETIDENSIDFLMNMPLGSVLRNIDRSGWLYLKGTLKEVEKINKLAQIAGKTTLLKTGTDASEENFKQMVKEQMPGIIHIATHGYYVPPPDEKPKSTLLSMDDNYFKSNDDPLLRSGILLSGANQKWVHKQNTDSENDGILTALEISRLDLSNTELVVLSACETGLGDIKGSEGVYGLQRAFKMAGAKRQIVSLWQVPDKETAEMMELFYTYLFEDKLSYSESFNKAQNTMKQNYPNEPLKWAGFVLVE